MSISDLHANCPCIVSQIAQVKPSPFPACSMMQTMEAEFRREAALRLRVLDGERIEDQLQPLYSDMAPMPE